MSASTRHPQEPPDPELVCFYVNETLCAVDVARVLTIDAYKGGLCAVPGSRPGLLGLAADHRGNRPVPVYDLAVLLGVESGQDSRRTLIETLTAREKDHVDWLDALEASVRDGVPFTRATDPHACAFGQWYDRFRTRDEVLGTLLEKFDEPHRRIHALGARLLGLRDAGRVDEALAALEEERTTTLQLLRRLFTRAREQLRAAMRPVTLYLDDGDGAASLGLVLDEIHSVERVPATGVRAAGDIGIGSGADVLHGVARAGDRDILWLDVDHLTGCEAAV